MAKRLAPNRHRHFIKECLEHAIRQAGQALGVEDAERPEIDHDTKDEPGMVEIANTILRKIAESAVFVADLTPLGRTESGKALANPNVLIELGWALNKPGPVRLIGVFNSAKGWTAQDLPFDIRHRRAMHYNLPEGADRQKTEAAKKKLTRELTDAIRINLSAHIEETAAATDIMKVAANANDPSIWASAKKTVNHNDIFGRSRSDTVTLSEPPRSYIRIIPAGWTRGAPSVHDIASLPDELKLWPPYGGARSGDYGANEEGYFSYWLWPGINDGTRKAENFLCFFDQTGEVWIVHGSAVADGPSGPTLIPGDVLSGWSNALRRSLAIFDKFEALQARRVEVGLVGVKGVRWASASLQVSPLSRKDRFLHWRQNRDWIATAQMKFLTEAYNGVRDLFALPKVMETETKALCEAR